MFDKIWKTLKISQILSTNNICMTQGKNNNFPLTQVNTKRMNYTFTILQLKLDFRITYLHFTKPLSCSLKRQASMLTVNVQTENRIRKIPADRILILGKKN